MTTDANGPIVVEIHPVGPTERSSRSIVRKGGSRIELRIVPIADCPDCPKTQPGIACGCCGEVFLGRLAIAHGPGSILCMACLAARTIGTSCGHEAPDNRGLMALVQGMERHQTN